MKTADEHKEASIARLKQEGIPYIDWLPTIEAPEEAVLKSPEVIAERLVACLLTIQASFDQQADNYDVEAVAWYQRTLSQYGITTLTGKEQALFEMRADEQDRINMTWQYEALWALLWALGLIDDLKFPSEPMTEDECDFAIDVVSSCADMDELLAKVQPRTLEEILDAADLIYRYHWACVNARINGRQMPQGLFESVVMERRRGLDWLFKADADWDYPELST